MIRRYAYLAPVVLRIALAAVFIVHGWPKLVSPARATAFFEMIGIPAPSLMVIVVGLVEVVGGLALLAGVGTRIAAALLAANMLGAILTAKRSAPFVGGWEFDMVLLAAAVSLLLSGPVGEPAADQVRISGTSATK